MSNPTVWYCYDAYCGWCYGFSPVISKAYQTFNNDFNFEVLSGGMILSDQPAHIGVMAGYIAKAYKQVEDTTGIRFGQDYLWHIMHPEDSDWYPDSMKPAVALCIFKEFFPDKSVEWASDLQHALHHEGRDLTDDEAYRHLLIKYGIPEDVFYQKLHEDSYKEKAKYDFQLVKQLQVTGYPTVLVQVSDSKFYMVARGFTPWEILEQNLRAVLSLPA
jgi:putative protein-disulfide isomerase